MRWRIALAAFGIGSAATIAFLVRPKRRMLAGSGAKLMWTPEAVEDLIDRKGAAVVQMRPDDFLDLTIDTSIDAWEAFVDDEMRPLDDYNKWMRTGKIRVGPFLKVREDNGDVISHEGRHRALALKRAGGDWFLVGIILANEHGYAVRGRGPEDVPRVFSGQFKRVTKRPHAIFPLDKMLEAAQIRASELEGPRRAANLAVARNVLR